MNPITLSELNLALGSGQAILDAFLFLIVAIILANMHQL
jgi:hypothetical protein